MTNQVYVGPARLRRPGKAFLVPLLIFSLVIYNLIAFVFFGGRPTGWSNQIFAIFMASGAPWVLTLGDLMVVIGLICLFFEIMKSTRIGSSSIIEHILSTGVFILFLIEFILVGYSADDERLLQAGPAFITGEYTEPGAVPLIREQRGHVAFIPSIWPETWCFALTRAWQAGLPAVVFDLGAQADRVRATGRGTVLPLGLEPARVNDALLRLATPQAASHSPPSSAQ